MDLLFSLLDHPLVPWAIGLGILFFVYKNVAPRLKLNVPGGNLGPDLADKVLGSRWTERKLEREVEPEHTAGQLVFNPGESAGHMKGHNAIGILDLASLEPEIVLF